MCVKSASGCLQPFEHQVDHRDVDPSFSCFRQFLIVFAEPSAPAQPGKCALYNPPPVQRLELMAVGVSSHYLQQPSSSGQSPRHQLAGVGRIGPDDLDPREFAQHMASTSLAPSRSWILAEGSRRSDLTQSYLITNLDLCHTPSWSLLAQPKQAPHPVFTRNCLANTASSTALPVVRARHR